MAGCLLLDAGKKEQATGHCKSTKKEDLPQKTELQFVGVSNRAWVHYVGINAIFCTHLSKTNVLPNFRRFKKTPQ